jgi:predicted branched-subunit amino acid permease
MYKIYYNSASNIFEYMTDSAIHTVEFPVKVTAVSLLTDEQVATTVSREIAENLMVDEWDLYINS